jgi:hypothetical protein
MCYGPNGFSLELQWKPSRRAFRQNHFGRPAAKRTQTENIMSTDNRIVPGIVKNGVVVPQSGIELPDGAHVNIVLQPATIPQDLKEELEAWQRAGGSAWQMIDKWESEDQ